MILGDTATVLILIAAVAALLAGGTVDDQPGED